MKYLVTGAAGFVGFHVAKSLMKGGHPVVGIDNLNSYYDQRLKKKRLEILKTDANFEFELIDIEDLSKLGDLWRRHRPDVVIHLAAQAGVRYSIENPAAYLKSNIIGFQNMVDLAREFRPSNFVYASSSSVYGLKNEAPYSESQALLSPASLYAATKISNEAVASSYSHLYGINMVGLRFFTVFGPYGRPDMALYKFARLMLNGKPIEIYNEGNLSRDWTYIDDIVSGILAASNQRSLHEVYNLGKGAPDKLVDAICYLEAELGVKAKKLYLPMQIGDVYSTHADISKSGKILNYHPKTNLNQGIAKFVEWVKDHREFFYD